jgi:aryl-alcohol dehydrogenase-like predicted oxidoreductase
MQLRQLGTTAIQVSPIALGCWPIAGMSSADVNDQDSLATIRACFELGINFLDTAYAYGLNGESETLIAHAIADRRADFIIASKGGIHWTPPRVQVIDGRPETLKRELDTSLDRLGTDYIDLYYLHAPDPNVPIAESAGAIRRFIEQGKARAAGVSNVTLDQLKEFAANCPLAAFQPHYNMLQREIEVDTLPWCVENHVAVCVYWPLMKGLLAGRIPREHVFPTIDSRHKYPMFQGDEWQRNNDFVDELRTIADEAGRTVSQLVLNWTIHRPGITVALVGAKRPEQIRENAAAVGWQLTHDQLERIDAAIKRRGRPITRAAV